MAKGIFLYKYTEKSQPEMMEKYYIDEIESKIDISNSLLTKIAEKHKIYDNLSAGLKRSLSYRTEDRKYFSIYIAKTQNDDNILLNFILDITESTEPFSISTGEMKRSIKDSIEKGEIQLQEVLKNILSSRNQLVEDIGDPQRIKERLVIKANKMIDEEKIDEAQKLLKRADEIPPKIADLVKKGNEAFSNDDLKAAQKLYDEAANLATKINQSSMNELLKRKARRAEEIPKFNKNWSQLYDKLSKLLKKIEKRETTFYLEPINQVNRAIEISDMLEDDETISTLQKLEDLLQKGESLTKRIEDVNTEIKQIMDSLKEN
jgi:hypothetical protein